MVRNQVTVRLDRFTGEVRRCYSNVFGSGTKKTRCRKTHGFSTIPGDGVSRYEITYSVHPKTGAPNGALTRIDTRTGEVIACSFGANSAEGCTTFELVD